MKDPMKEESKEHLNGKSKEETSKIDAIKELLFGDNIQAYDSEFEYLKTDILTKKEALEGIIDDVRKELMQSIDSLSTDVNIRITDIESSLNDKMQSLDEKKVNKTVLSNLLIKLGEQIGK